VFHERLTAAAAPLGVLLHTLSQKSVAHLTSCDFQ